MSTGLNDTTQFPDDDPLIRQHLQDYLDATYNKKTDFTKGTNWRKSPDGLIEQRGKIVNTTSNMNTILNYPIAFNVKVDSIVAHAIFKDVNTNALTVPWYVEEDTLGTYHVRWGSATGLTSVTIYWEVSGN